MTTTDILKQLEKAVTELVTENTQLKNRLQDIQAAIGALGETTAPKTAAAPIKTKPIKAPRITKQKRGRKFLFSDAQVLAIREQHNKGASVLALAKEHKVSPPTIYNALTRGLSTPIKASTNGAGAGKH